MPHRCLSGQTPPIVSQQIRFVVQQPPPDRGCAAQPQGHDVTIGLGCTPARVAPNQPRQNRGMHSRGTVSGPPPPHYLGASPNPSCRPFLAFCLCPSFRNRQSHDDLPDVGLPTTPNRVLGAGISCLIHQSPTIVRAREDGRFRQKPSLPPGFCDRDIMVRHGGQRHSLLSCRPPSRLLQRHTRHTKRAGV